LRGIDNSESKESLRRVYPKSNKREYPKRERNGYERGEVRKKIESFTLPTKADLELLDNLKR